MSLRGLGLALDGDAAEEKRADAAPHERKSPEHANGKGWSKAPLGGSSNGELHSNWRSTAAPPSAAATAAPSVGWSGSVAGQSREEQTTQVALERLRDLSLNIQARIHTFERNGNSSNSPAASNGARAASSSRGGAFALASPAFSPDGSTMQSPPPAPAGSTPLSPPEVETIRAPAPSPVSPDQLQATPTAAGAEAAAAGSRPAVRVPSPIEKAALSADFSQLEAWLQEELSRQRQQAEAEARVGAAAINGTAVPQELLAQALQPRDSTLRGVGGSAPATAGSASPGSSGLLSDSTSLASGGAR